jgi:hypothetical protein
MCGMSERCPYFTGLTVSVEGASVLRAEVSEFEHGVMTLVVCGFFSTCFTCCAS